MPIDASKVQWDTPAPDAVQWDDQPKPADFNLKGEGWEKLVNYSPRNAIGGQVRGAGSLGATLLRPFESAEENEGRRKNMDEGLKNLIGADPNSMSYQTNKLIAEVAGTAGIPGMFAKGLRAIPGVANALPTLIPAIETGGMSANGATGAYGMANRVAGGGVSGAVTAGAVNPKDAAEGMMIGGAAPVVVKTLGTAGEKVGDYMAQRTAEQLRKFNSKAPLNQTIKESIEAGYVIPPASVDPSFKNRLIESISGKQATQQVASTKNNKVTERLVRQSLGLADDAPLDRSTLESLRKTAGKAYAEVSALSDQAAADLEALKKARNEASGWFKAYNRSARPDDLAKAKEFRAQSEALELALEKHAADAGKTELIPALRDARKQIAKTYTVDRALTDASGNVDARILGRLYEKGVPLSDGLDTAGRFGSAFKSVAKTPEQIGSPATHNLNAMASLLLGGGGAGAAALGGAGAVTTGGLGAAAAALPFVAPPIARAAMFRKGAQQSLVQSAPKGTSDTEALVQLLRNPELMRLIQAAPVAGASTSP